VLKRRIGRFGASGTCCIGLGRLGCPTMKRWQALAMSVLQALTRLGSIGRTGGPWVSVITSCFPGSSGNRTCSAFAMPTPRTGHAVRAFARSPEDGLT
jgi:hypothetical protein